MLGWAFSKRRAIARIAASPSAGAGVRSSGFQAVEERTHLALGTDHMQRHVPAVLRHDREFSFAV